MKTTVAEIKRLLEDVPDDFEVRILVPCRAIRQFVEIEKEINDYKLAASRRLVILETTIVELGPR